MEKREYRLLNEAIEWIAGRRVQEGEPLMLTAREAEYDLARGNIELAEPSRPPALPAPESAAKGRRGD